MFQLNFLSKENDLNKILKRNRRSKEDLSILFISLWDEYCSSLVEKLKSEYDKIKNGENLYVVDSFKMPHSFVIFNSTKIPHLVQMRGDGIISEDYLPMIMKNLNIK